MNWIEAYYWQSRQLNQTLTPALKAPLTTSGYFSSDKDTSAPMPPRVPEPMLEPQQLTLPGFESALPVNSTDATGTSVLIEGSIENH